jgi:MYXO-CTERM domain-containing protein
MDIEETIAKARDAITVKRVYGDPYEREGVTVIPAASVGGGGGGGSGEGPETGQTGGGSGFGLGARPVGAYVIADGQVRWEPAVDVSRIATQALLALGLLVLLLGWRRRS